MNHPQHILTKKARKPGFAAISTAILLFFTATSQALVTSSANGADEDERALQNAARAAFGTHQSFPFFKNVGFIENSTGVYVGNGYVLTAAHVGSGVFRMSDGSSYLPVRGSERRILNPNGSEADLCLFRIAFDQKDSIARLPNIPLGPITPPEGSKVLFLSAGLGADRPGYAWNGRSVIRWGLNRVSSVFTDWIETHGFRTAGFATSFDPIAGHCQAAPGDSGGAVFVYNTQAGAWQLGGIILAVDSEEQAARVGDSTYIGSLQVLPEHLFGADRLIATR